MKKLLKKISTLTKRATKKIRDTIDGATKVEKALAILMIGVELFLTLFLLGHTTLGLISCVIASVSAKKVLKDKTKSHKKPFVKRVFGTFNNLVCLSVSELKHTRKTMKALTKKERVFYTAMLIVGYTLSMLAIKPSMTGAMLSAGIILAQCILLGFIDLSGIAKVKKLKTKTQELLVKASKMSFRERLMMLILAYGVSSSIAIVAKLGLIGLILSHAFSVAFGVRLGIIGIEEAPEEKEVTVPQKTNN